MLYYSPHSLGKRSALAALCLVAFTATAFPQGTLADYERAQNLPTKARGLVVNTPGAMSWIGDTDHVWYPRTVKGGTEFVLVDATAGTKKLAFDHEKLAAAISSATGKSYTGLKLPFAPDPNARPAARRPVDGSIPTSSPLVFVDGEKAIRFGTGGVMYKCTLTEYACAKEGSIPPVVAGFRDVGPDATNPESLVFPQEAGGDPMDGLEYQPPAPQNGDEGRYGPATHSCAQQPRRSTQSRLDRAAELGVGSQFPGQLAPEPPEVCASFDGKWEAFIQNYNVFLKPVGNHPGTPLSFDGSEGNYYTLRSVAWSPDSKKLVAYHTRPGYDRQVMYIESSPADQIQPKHMAIHYRKPGDALDIAYPALFDIDSRKEIEIDHALFPNPYSLSPPVWWKDSRAFTFEYNQRGHQAYTVIEVDAQTGKTRPLIAETRRPSSTTTILDRVCPLAGAIGTT